MLWDKVSREGMGEDRGAGRGSQARRVTCGSLRRSLEGRQPIALSKTLV